MHGGAENSQEENTGEKRIPTTKSRVGETSGRTYLAQAVE